VARLAERQEEPEVPEFHRRPRLRVQAEGVPIGLALEGISSAQVARVASQK
jgi:hypothetical protein